MYYILTNKISPNFISVCRMFDLYFKVIYETLEAKEEFKKRIPTAESLFGVLKQQGQLNTLYVREIGKVKNRVMLKTIAYNMKRLANIVEEKHMQEKIFNVFSLC